jgi:hypothetical protein
MNSHAVKETLDQKDPVALGIQRNAMNVKKLSRLSKARRKPIFWFTAID